MLHDPARPVNALDPGGPCELGRSLVKLAVVNGCPLILGLATRNICLGDAAPVLDLDATDADNDRLTLDSADISGTSEGAVTEADSVIDE
mmetsp:Transcript_112820/g.177512  ORF Transcript_112820/g.177512 Transcript_112820/m.177512 type:complete len:90 (+) Transcript_112820:209-478(+)